MPDGSARGAPLGRRQRIELDTGKAINEVEFYVPPLYNGKLTITASFQVASPQRVDITYENSTLVRRRARGAAAAAPSRAERM